MTHLAGTAAHIFSVDLEDWFHVSAFERHVARDDWARMPSRVVRSTEHILDLLDAGNHTATFFVLGWQAEREPELIRRIVTRGHEVASHTWWHRRVYSQTPAEFLADVTQTKDLLEQITGAAVEGFRAPSFSITPAVPWAFEQLAAAGYRYDSSIFPIRRRGYGWAGASSAPHTVQTAAGMLTEYPLATFSVGKARLPGAGGAYLRHLPLAVVHAAIRASESTAQPAMLYVHPWEVDPDQPRLSVGLLTRWRHYGGLRNTSPRLAALFRRYRFLSVRDWEQSYKPTARSQQ